MRRAGPAPILVLCGLLGACRGDDVGVTQDLATLQRAYSGDRPVALHVDANTRRVAATTPGPLDLTVRTPDSASLRYGLPPELAPADFSVGLVADGSVTPLTPVLGQDGTWRAPLPDAGDAITGLRLEAKGGAPVALFAPRIEGRSPRTPPILPPAMRRGGRPPNVILYVVDTLRTDRMSLYGYGKPTTPALERLAKDAVVFEGAYAAGSFTMPSVSALLASRYPEELRGMLDAAGPAQRTLAEAFQAAGYETAGFQANLLVTPALGFDRGFDHYQILGEVGADDAVAKASAATLHAAALAWVQERVDRPFFLFLQTMDVHYPYVPPSPFRDLFAPPLDEAKIATTLAAMREKHSEAEITAFFERLGNMNPDRYDGAIAYADHELGVLFDALRRLGVADRTIIALTADHGEPLGERGQWAHGQSLFEELVRVPLILWVPGTHGERRIDEVVTQLDLAPTLLDLAGLEAPSSFAGRSWLSPGTRMRPPSASGDLLMPLTLRSDAWFVREGPWKLILDREGAKLFHLPSDPREATDVSAAHPDVTRYLVGRATTRPVGTASVPEHASGLTDEQRREREKALRALGYVH